MKAEDLKTKTVDELTKMLMDARKAQFNLRFQRAGGQLENTAEVRRTRRAIARIKTFLNARKNEGDAPKGTTAKAKKAPAKTKAAKTKKSAKAA